MDETAPSRDQIVAVVKKHIHQVIEDIDLDVVDTSVSMKELGANSLDIVDVVSRTMRELRIKVPRAELTKLTDIDGFVDLLHEKAVEKAEQSARVAEQPSA